MDSEYIRKKREELGWTQADLAEKIGVTLNTIQNYESGKVIPKTKHSILRKAFSGAKSELSDTERNDYERINERLERMELSIARMVLDIGIIKEMSRKTKES